MKPMVTLMMNTARDLMRTPRTPRLHGGKLFLLVSRSSWMGGAAF